MKKTILALTIPALFATSAASAVTVYSDEGAQVDIYGRIQFDAGSFGYQGAKEAENFGSDGSVRLGTNVKYTLNNDVDLIGKAEWQVTAESSDDAKTQDIDARYAWAGFRFMDTTELTFGRSQDPLAQVIYLTDVMNLFGGAVAYGESLGVSDKADDQVRVSYAANGLDLRAAYAFADADKVDNNLDKENQWSVSAGYTLPIGLGVFAAYEQRNFGAANSDLDAWFGGLSYTLDGIYLAGLYTQREQGDLESKGYELHAQYNVDAWTLMAQYSNEVEEAPGVADVDTIDAVTLGVQYDLTAKAKLYAEYLIQNNDADQDDLYGLGIQYNF